MIKESTTDETWFHFNVGNRIWWVNSDDPLCELTDINGDRILQLSFRNRTENGWTMRTVMDGNIFSDARFIPFLNASVRTIDIQVKLGTLQAEFRVYVNELLLLERSFAYNQLNARKPRFMWIGGGNSDGNFLNATHYSEIIVADGDTRNARLDLLRPVSAGVYGNWDGPLVSLSDDDPTTGMTTVSPNQSQSTILTPYTGANNISNIVQVTTTVRGLNSPTKLRHLIRMSGVDYLTPDFDVPFSKEYQVTDWTQNPATSAPWAATDLVNVEFGFRSIA
ncbi:hypothetical protein vBRpoPV17_78 [Ruegeria phage vB_RpoP-V17]|nr:hypothetical protein HYP62_gp82 [Ruegeria phage vB_RpoP-V12]AWY08869.1 hypothetical protein vBRpoPV12_82 [Ruegeria phage vB_RpoP-V12]AWY09036.1 hypothetical protein vBRpoPV21_79 [Ruegeria phage vB_RpoP-V21]AWY09597.1 hypothetical protein vBRpoPV17_78 [Ruegeria phage vB_RpoP-V17]